MAVGVKPIERIYPDSATLSIENDIDTRQMVGGRQIPQLRGRITRIAFRAMMDKCSFKDHPLMGDKIEIALDKDVHLVIIENMDITYTAPQGLLHNEVTGSGIVVDTFESDEHPLKRAVDRATKKKL